MMPHPAGLPRRELDVVVVVLAVVLGTFATIGGLYWIAHVPTACACPGKFPLGGYFALNAVRVSAHPGTYQTSVRLAPLPPGPFGTSWPSPPPLSALSFHVVASNGTNLGIGLVCAVAANGSVLGTWSGSSGGWATHLTQPPPSCGPSAIPVGSAPPGSNLFQVGSVLFYYLTQPAPAGTVFSVGTGLPAEASPWTGSISQTLA